MNDDLISRQAAIDALKEHRALYCDNTPASFSELSFANKSRVDELDTAIATLINLPSAQLTQNNRVNSNNALDTISRQEAIDAVCMEWCNVKHQNCEHPFDIEKDDYYWCDGCETALQTLPNLPSAQPEGIKYVELSEEDYEKMAELMRKNSLILTSAEPERTRILETRAIPSDDDCVSLSETVTTTYYDEEKEEWSRKIVTVRDVLDSVCDEYTILPSAQPERDIPMKPNETIDSSWGIRKKQAVCPKCDYYLGHVEFIGNPNGKKVTYCETCGQAIDWEGWEWEEE